MKSRIASIEDMSVDELLASCPVAIPVFLRNRMRCVGCPIAPFHTLAEAAALHNIATADLLRELEGVIERKGYLNADQAPRRPQSRRSGADRG